MKSKEKDVWELIEMQNQIIEGLNRTVDRQREQIKHLLIYLEKFHKGHVK